MATLNFPSSDQSPFEAPNGVTYVWNNDGYWEASGDSLNDIYLSSTVDDAAAGEITFQGRTLCEDNIIFSPDKGIRLESGVNDIKLREPGYITGIEMSPGGHTRGLSVNFVPTEVTSNDLKGVISRLDTELSLESGKSYAAYDTNIVDQDCDGDIIGFRGSIATNMNSGSGKAYNMYCSSRAPVFIQGNLEIGEGQILQGPNRASTSPACRFNGENADYNFIISNTGVVTTKPTADNIATGTSGQLRVNGGGQIQKITTYRSRMTEVEDVTNIDGLAIVQQLQLKRWKDINDGEVGIGFIAEDVHAAGAQSIVLSEPYEAETHGTEAVTFGGEQLAEGTPVITDFAQAGLMGVLVEAIKQLDARLTVLEGN